MIQVSPQETSRGETSPETYTFYSMLRDQQSDFFPQTIQIPCLQYCHWLSGLPEPDAGQKEDKSKARNVRLSYLALLGGALIHQPASTSISQQQPESDATMRREDPHPERQDTGSGGGDPSLWTGHQLQRCEVNDWQQTEPRAAPLLLSLCSTSLTAKYTRCLHRSCVPC